MDSLHKIWMFNNWIQDQNDDVELTKNHALLIGSFTNPEAVRKMMDDGNTFTSSDEDFDKSTEMIDKINNVSEKSRKKKRRRIK